MRLGQRPGYLYLNKLCIINILYSALHSQNSHEHQCRQIPLNVLGNYRNTLSGHDQSLHVMDLMISILVATVPFMLGSKQWRYLPVLCEVEGVRGEVRKGEHEWKTCHSCFYPKDFNTNWAKMISRALIYSRTAMD